MYNLGRTVWNKRSFCLIATVIIIVIICHSAYTSLIGYFLKFEIVNSQSTVRLHAFENPTDRRLDKSTATELQSSTWPSSQPDIFTRGARTEKIECQIIKTPRLSTEPLPPTALVSFPGAGNTWVRHLLQQVSGLATASVYCDEALRDNGFPFECHRRFQDVLAVKTHRSPTATKPFKRIILIIRRPLPNLLAFFKWRHTKDHVGYPKLSTFEKSWPTFAYEQTKKWKHFNEAWLCNYIGSLHPLVYENLKEDPYNELKRLFEFLQVEVNDVSLKCAIENQEGNFHRSKVTVLTDKTSNRTLSLDNLFTEEMVQSASEVFHTVEECLQSKFNMTWVK